jgi:hypothetical protein
MHLQNSLNTHNEQMNHSFLQSSNTKILPCFTLLYCEYYPLISASSAVAYNNILWQKNRYVSYRYIHFQHTAHWSATDISVFWFGTVKIKQCMKMWNKLKWVSTMPRIGFVLTIMNLQVLKSTGNLFMNQVTIDSSRNGLYHGVNHTANTNLTTLHYNCTIAVEWLAYEL